MSNKFKFRVWDKRFDCYRKKDRHNGADNCLDIYSGLLLYGEGFEIYGEHNPNDFIIEQCTGLKDKNGKLIYEGDILGGIFGMPVFWCEKCCSFEVGIPMDDGTIECSSCDNNVLWVDVVTEDDLEVIGNIHENLDLLEN